MRRAEIVTAVILGLLSLYLMWKSGEPPSWDPTVPRFANIGLIEGEGPGSGFWPFWLSAIMLLCCVWTGVNWWRRKTPASRSDAPYLDAHGKRMLVLVGGGVLALVAMVEVIGAYGAMFVFLIYYMSVLGRHSWPITLTIAVMTPVISFFFFDVAMRIVLPKGWSEPLFLPLYDIFL